MIGIAVFGATLAILVGGVLWWPSIGLTAFLAMFGLKQWGVAKIALLAHHFSATNYIVGAIVVMALAIRAMRGQVGWPLLGDISRWAVALYLYAAVTLLWTTDEAAALFEFRSNLPYIALSVVFVPLLIRDVRDAAVALNAMIVIGLLLLTALSFFVSWKYRAIASDVIGGEVVRLPASLAEFSGYTLISAVMLSRGKLLRYCAMLACAVFAFVVAVKTGSRGQLFAMSVCAVLMLPASFGYRNSHRLLGPLLLIGLLGMLLGSLDAGALFSEVHGRWSIDNLTAGYEVRVDRAGRLLSLWAAEPLTILFGLGNSASFGPLNGYIHIMPIEVLCELGVVGLLIYFMCIWRSGAVILRALRSIGSGGPDHVLRNHVLAALIAMSLMEFLLSFKQGSLLRNYYLFVFPIILQNILSTERARVRSLRIVPARVGQMGESIAVNAAVAGPRQRAS